MSSPVITTLKTKKSDKMNIKIFIYYSIVIFILLLLFKPPCIMKKDYFKKEKRISITKLIFWEIVLCLPLIFYYIIN